MKVVYLYVKPTAAFCVTFLPLRHHHGHDHHQILLCDRHDHHLHGITLAWLFLLRSRHFKAPQVHLYIHTLVPAVAAHHHL